jgi:uncharacterized protein (TIGR03663 family)
MDNSATERAEGQHPVSPHGKPKPSTHPHLKYSFLILVIGIGAFFLRVPYLDTRPLHTDEAVHAVKTGELLEQHTYIYDPVDFHGPTLYYAAWPLLRLWGAERYADIPSAVPLRLVPVLFGTALVLMLILVTGELGTWQAVFAAIFTALSPAMVYYSRYYIQEMLLVCFTFITIISAWRWFIKPGLGWALLAGGGIGLMQATKESCIVAFASILFAGLLTAAWTRWIDRRVFSRNIRPPWWHLVPAVLLAMLIAAVCLTAFFKNPGAIIQTLQGYPHYLQRAVHASSYAGEAGLHYHPWYHYLGTLAFARYGPGPWWSEALILVLSIVGIIASLLPSRESSIQVQLPRYLAFYTLLMLVVYSITPYKTPWLLLGFWHGMILTAGVGTVVIMRILAGKTQRFMVLTMLGVGLWHLGYQVMQGNFVFHSDTRNPYVYAHTSTNLPMLAQRIEDLAGVHPDGSRMVVKVMTPENDYWPLPWYLRRLENVGYWDEIPEEPDAPVMIVKPSLETELDARLKQTYVRQYYGLRPEVLLMVLVEEKLWESFMEFQGTRQPEVD